MKFKLLIMLMISNAFAIEISDQSSLSAHERKRLNMNFSSIQKVDSEIKKECIGCDHKEDENLNVPPSVRAARELMVQTYGSCEALKVGLRNRTYSINSNALISKKQTESIPTGDYIDGDKSKGRKYKKNTSTHKAIVNESAFRSQHYYYKKIDKLELGKKDLCDFKDDTLKVYMFRGRFDPGAYMDDDKIQYFNYAGEKVQGNYNNNNDENYRCYERLEDARRAQKNESNNSKLLEIDHTVGALCSDEDNQYGKLSGIDCTGFVSAALRKAGRRMTPRIHTNGEYMYDLNTKKRSTHKIGIGYGEGSCFDIPKFGNQKEMIKPGDMLNWSGVGDGSDGHIMMVETVGSDPYGLVKSGVKDISECESKVDQKNYQFTVIQSSGVVGVNRQHISSYDGEKTKAYLKRLGVVACKAHFCSIDGGQVKDGKCVVEGKQVVTVGTFDIPFYTKDKRFVSNTIAYTKKNKIEENGFRIIRHKLDDDDPSNDDEKCKADEPKEFEDQKCIDQCAGLDNVSYDLLNAQ